jgi:transcriptional regulator with XRE-family HTH domain
LRGLPEYQTDAALAKAAGVSPSTLSRITENSGGSVDLLERFSKLLGRNPDDISTSPRRRPRLNELEGFDDALAQARAVADFSDAVWAHVALMDAPLPGQKAVDARTMLKAAELIDTASGIKSGKVRTIPHSSPKRR